MDPRSIKQQLVRLKPQDIDIKWVSGIYREILQIALNPSISDKCPGIDALSIWQHRATQLINQSNDLKGLNEICSDDDFAQIFSFICNNWTDSGAALGNALRDLFQKTIILLSKIRSETAFIEILKIWTKKVVALPKHVRMVYFGLEHLTRYVGSQFILNEYPSLIDEVLPFMRYNGLASSISRALSALLTNLDPESWAIPILSTIRQHPETYSNIQSYLLPTIFKANSKSLSLFLEYIAKDEEFDQTTSLELLADCTKIALINGLKSDFHVDKSQKPFLEKLVQHKLPSIRSSGLSLIAADVKGSAPIGIHELEIIKGNADIIFNECDSGSRNKILGHFRNIITRLRGYTYSLSRNANKPTKQDGNELKSIEFQISYYLEFCQWILNYAKNLLRPGSPHQSLIVGSQILIIMIRSGLDIDIDKSNFEKGYLPYPFTVTIFKPEIVTLLVDNVMNNYDDIRNISIEILKMSPRPVPLLENNKNIKRLDHRAHQMLSGIRGREGDSAARLADLIFYLYGSSGVKYIEQLTTIIHEQNEIAQNDLSLAVLEHPIHGYFSTLRFIFTNMDYKVHSLNIEIINDICNSIIDVWNIVKPILSHESPEGNIPEGLEDMYNSRLEETYGPAAQVILSYAWRTVKESSSLLTTFLQKLPDDLITDQLILKLSELILEQLAVVKHRGAFSSVYPSFIACCKRCFTRKSLQNRPYDWLKENINLIKLKSQYITRRSGGLPYLIVAILASVSSNEQETVFSNTLNELLQMAKQPAEIIDGKTDLPQVHAFNCIRVIFTDAELTSISASYLDTALELAIEYFSHDIWSIRNCSVMLFTALQNRLYNNNSEGTIPSRLFFSKHSNVKPILLKHLENHVFGQNEKHIETVYPVLSLLAKLTGVIGYDGLDEFIPLVIQCLSSKIWKIREMAARALGSMVADNIDQMYCDLIQNCTLSDQNTFHGSCLALENLISKSKGSERIENLLDNRLEELFFKNNSPETKLAFFRLLTVIFSKEKMLKTFKNRLPYSENEILSSSRRYCRSEVIKYVLNALSIEKSQPLCNTLMTDYAYEVQETVLEYMKEHINDSIDAEKVWNLFLKSDIASIKVKALSVFFKLVIIRAELVSNINEQWMVLYNDISPNSSESVRYACIEGLGIFTGKCDSIDKFDKWIEIIKEYSKDEQEYTTRKAALMSIKGYLKEKCRNIHCLLILFEFLMDDDEELRDSATEITCELFELTDKSNIFCQNVILQYICQLTDGIDQLTANIVEYDLSKQVELAWSSDNLLFSVEKHNLYRNDLEILEQTMREMMKCGDKLSLKSKRRLNDWVEEGRAGLMNGIETDEREQEESWPETNAMKYYLKRKVEMVEGLVRGEEMLNRK